MTTVCPVCGEPVGSKPLNEIEGESVPADRICVADWPDEIIIHFEETEIEVETEHEH